MRFLWYALISILIFSSCTEEKKVGQRSNVLPYDIAIHKPTAPITVDICFLSEPKPKEKVKLCFSATPDIEVQDFEMKINLPDDITLTDGNCNWQGKQKAKHKRELVIECIIPDEKSREITACATIKSLNNAVLTNVCSLYIGNPQKPQSKGKERVNSKGEKLIEFEGVTR